MSFYDSFIIAVPQVHAATNTYYSSKPSKLETVITHREKTPRNSIFNAGVAEPGVGEFTGLLMENIRGREK
jgi:hypothetical protein